MTQAATYVAPPGLHPRVYDYVAIILSELEEQEAIHRSDSVGLDLLAESLHTWYTCADRVKREGMIVRLGGALTRHPLIKVGVDAQIQAVKLLQEYGLTPKSRERIKAMSSGEADDDPFAAFLASSTK